MPRQIALLESEFPELEQLENAKRRRRRGGDPELEKPSAEDLFASQLAVFGGLEFVRQYHFALKAGRNWRFDFAFPRHQVAVEIDGVAVQRLEGRLVVLGRHASIDGIRGDYEKINTAQLLGWTVLRFLQTDVKPKRAIEFTVRVLEARGFIRRSAQ
jgi:very-short-patch-repair endonuclease